MASSCPTLLTFLLFTASTCCFSGCFGENVFPGQSVGSVLQCFDIELIDNGCNNAYRLNPSGHVNVPPEDTRLFCNGPCLEETQLVLNCVENMLASFLFSNGASVRNIRNAIQTTCSYATQQGNFNGGWLWEGERSRSDMLRNRIGLGSFMPFGFLFLI